MMIKEIAEFILAHCGSALGFTFGVDYFAGHLPDKNILGLTSPNRVCVVLDRVPAGVIGDLPDRLDAHIQVWNRASTYFEARDDAWEIFECLHGETGWALPVLVSGKNYYAMIIDAEAAPAPIANPNAKGLFEFSTNYLFRLENP
jgi:hypothetical protein